MSVRQTRAERVNCKCTNVLHYNVKTSRALLLGLCQPSFAQVMTELPQSSSNMGQISIRVLYLVSTPVRSGVATECLLSYCRAGSERSLEYYSTSIVERRCTSTGEVHYYTATYGVVPWTVVLPVVQ
jgi:hypothetical protein